MKLEIGIDEKNREEIAKGLSRLLADTYSLYLKTHYFHWNVIGPFFSMLHKMFERQYEELATAVDLVAERIRALGHHAPGTYTEFTQLSTVEETTGVPAAEEMLRILMDGHQTVIRTSYELLKTSNDANDQGTTDLIGRRLLAHQKAIWMLKSHLDFQKPERLKAAS